MRRKNTNQKSIITIHIIDPICILLQKLLILFVVFMAGVCITYGTNVNYDGSKLVKDLTKEGRGFIEKTIDTTSSAVAKFVK